ncbi:MAG: KpsD protein [Rariglobus sp.]|jgi:protein involved in polysaccharide export with SLBB domain|nr:KpsD protein [Rariglobus sp.]
MKPRPFLRFILAAWVLAAPAMLPAQLAIQTNTPSVAQEMTSMEVLQPKVSPVVVEEAPATPTPFGAHLFKGDFTSVSFSGFNPDYEIAVGDQLKVMLWGSVQSSLALTVDAQGNIFIPEVGPITVAGVRNQELDRFVRDRVQQVYIKGVSVYTNLASAQPVKVFVTGYVQKPGLYGGNSSDIMLYFLSKAGGIDPDRGSYIDISLIRNREVVESINLYDFLATGKTHRSQFRDGDTLLVNARHHYVQLNGEVLNASRFEFKSGEIPLADLLKLAQVNPNSTHVSILRSTPGRSDAEVHAIDAVNGLVVKPNDLITVLRRSRPHSLMVSVMGEQDGEIRLVLPYGSTLGDALGRITPAARSSLENVQLFRKSVAARQKAMLDQSLDNLARSVTSTPSDSLEEAQLRQVETQTILAFIERARKVEPKGQILLGPRPESDSIHLENGDILYVPAHTRLVSVYGEIRFPNTQTYQRKFKATDYIRNAGGYTDTADEKNVIIIQNNGATMNLALTGKSARSYRPEPGDEIIVLPEPDTKNLQFAKDITGILYQIAIGARVVLDP